MKDITTNEFNLIRDHIKKNYGINLGEEKRSLVMARLRNVLLDIGLDNFSDYYDYLIHDKTGEAATTFIDRMSTNHTFFMRETDHFTFFQNAVLPEIKKRPGNKDIRLWCAGCSSGEEAYTLQILLQEFLGPDAPAWDTTLLATDISISVLRKAYAGIYTAEQIKTLPDDWQRKYFDQINKDQFEVKKNIKDKVIFRSVNLMEERFPLKKNVDIIFCRNVMIYFDTPTKDKLVQKFYDITNHGGYLFIGHSETLNYSATSYKYIIPAVYRKS